MAVEGSWPVIKAFLRFTPIATHLNKKTASRLIEDSEEEMRNADLTTAWPNYLAGNGIGDSHYLNKIGDPLVRKTVSKFNVWATFDCSLKFAGPCALGASVLFLRHGG
jgi:hypothetical protein